MVWSVGSARKPRAPTQEPVLRDCSRPQLFSEFSPTMSDAQKKKKHHHHHPQPLWLKSLLDVSSTAA